MTLLSFTTYRHAVYPGEGRSIQSSGIKVTPLRSGGERSRKDFVLNVSLSRALTTCSLKTPPYGKSKRINPRDLFTFSYRFNTDIPMSETPGHPSMSTLRTELGSLELCSLISANERSLVMKSGEFSSSPIQFLFLSASPVIVMRFVSKSNGKGYPPNVPVHATSLLLMEVTDYRLNGLDSNAMPSQLALTVRGTLYPQREGKKSLKGHVEMSVGFDLPPVLALVPEGIIRGVGETVLRQLAEQMKQDIDTGLAADFKKYRRRS